MKYEKRKIFLDWCLNWRRIQAATLVVLLFPLVSWAETVEVVASGMGMTADAATKAALRSAVEQVVGQLVDANTLVANEDVVSGKILTYSGGYVEGYEAIKEPAQGSDGLYSTKIKARVKKTELVEKLRAENVSQAEVSGTSLFAQMTTKQQQAEDAGAILADDFKEIPVRFLTAAVAKKPDGTPDLVLDESTGEVSANIIMEVDADAYENWLKGILPKLDVIADAKYEALLGFKNTGDLKAIIPRDIIDPDSQEDVTLCIEVEQSPDCRSAIWRYYKFTSMKAKKLDGLLKQTIFSHISIVAKMVDSSGRLLGGNTQKEEVSKRGGSIVYYGGNVYPIRCIGASAALWSDYVESMDGEFYKTIRTGSTTRYPWRSCGPCGGAIQFQMKLGAFSPEQIKAAASITCTISGIMAQD